MWIRKNFDYFKNPSGIDPAQPRGRYTPTERHEPMTAIAAAGLGLSAMNTFGGGGGSSGFDGWPMGPHGRRVEQYGLERLARMKKLGEVMPPGLKAATDPFRSGRRGYFEDAQEIAGRAASRQIKAGDERVLGAFEEDQSRSLANLDEDQKSQARQGKARVRENYRRAGLEHVDKNFGAGSPYSDWYSRHVAREREMTNQFGTLAGNLFAGLSSGVTNSYVAQQGFADLFRSNA